MSELSPISSESYDLSLARLPGEAYLAKIESASKTNAATEPVFSFEKTSHTPPLALHHFYFQPISRFSRIVDFFRTLFRMVRNTDYLLPIFDKIKAEVFRENQEKWKQEIKNLKHSNASDYASLRERQFLQCEKIIRGELFLYHLLDEVLGGRSIYILIKSANKDPDLIQALLSEDPKTALINILQEGVSSEKQENIELLLRQLEAIGSFTQDQKELLAPLALSEKIGPALFANFIDKSKHPKFQLVANNFGVFWKKHQTHFITSMRLGVGTLFKDISMLKKRIFLEQSLQEAAKKRLKQELKNFIEEKVQQKCADYQERYNVSAKAKAVRELFKNREALSLDCTLTVAMLIEALKKEYRIDYPKYTEGLSTLFNQDYVMEIIEEIYNEGNYQDLITENEDTVATNTKYLRQFAIEGIKSFISYRLGSAIAKHLPAIREDPNQLAAFKSQLEAIFLDAKEKALAYWQERYPDLEIVDLDAPFNDYVENLKQLNYPELTRMAEVYIQKRIEYEVAEAIDKKMSELIRRQPPFATNHSRNIYLAALSLKGSDREPLPDTVKIMLLKSISPELYDLHKSEIENTAKTQILELIASLNPLV